jgi:hypothetical protein
MTNQHPRTSFQLFLAKNLAKAELLCLTLVAIGIVMHSRSMTSTVLYVALAILAIILFLNTYAAPVQIEPADDEKLGLKELIALSVLPKVMWISCAVSVLGVLFYLIGSAGYKNLILIGGLSLGFSVLLFVFFRISGTRHLQIVTHVLMRAIPLLLIDAYLLLR